MRKALTGILLAATVVIQVRLSEWMGPQALDKAANHAVNDCAKEGLYAALIGVETAGVGPRDYARVFYACMPEDEVRH